MAFTLDPQTGKISFGVVADSTHDAIARDIAQEFGVSETFNDDFSSNNWTEDGSGDFTISGGVMNWETDDTILNHFSFIDMLGQTVSDTAWTLRFKLTIDNFAQGSDATNQELYIVLGDTTNTATESNQDAIGLRLVVDNSLREIRMINANGNNLQSGSGTLLATNISATTFYVEIKRTSAIGSTISLFSDENYSTLIESASIGISANIVDLRFLRIQNRNNLDGTNDHTLDGIIDDVQFWDGISVPVITSKRFRMRFELDITGLTTPSGADVSLWIGLSDEDEISGSNNPQDGFFLTTFVDSILNFFRVQTADNQAPRTAGSDNQMTTVPAVGTFFIEMIRNESQTTVNFYTDNTFVTISDTKTQAGISGTDNLKYLKLFNDEVPTNANKIDGTFDNFTFDDLTMVGDATLKTFIVDAILVVSVFTCGDKIIFQDDFSTAVNWVQTGTQVTITGGEIQGWGPDATTQRLTHDLVTPLSDKSWTAEFEFETSSFANPAHDIFVLTDTNTNSAGLQDHIAVRFGFSGGLIQFGILHGGNLALGSGTIMPITASINTRYFVRLQRITLGLARLTVFTGGFDSVLFGTIDVDLTLFGGTPTGLQFIISETSVLGGGARTLTGIIDNLVLTNACCNFEVDSFLQVTRGLCGIDLTDLKAYWNFNETSGVLVNQATAIGSIGSLGTSADGTVGGEIDRQQVGQVSDSYLFQGLTETQAGNRITIGSSVSQFNFMHTPNSKGTFNFWINPLNNTQAFADLFINQNNTSGNTGFLIAIANGFIQFRPRAPFTELLSTLTVSTILTPNVFNMVTIVWDELIGADVYINGVFIETLPRAVNVASSSNANFPLTIATRSNTQGNVTFDGFLDESTAWARKLTSAEITKLFVLGNGGNPIQTSLGGGGALCFEIDAVIKLTGDVLCGIGGPQTIFTEDFTTNTGWTYTGSFPNKLFVDGVSFPNVLRLECFRSTAVDGSQQIVKDMGVTFNQGNFQSGDIIWEFDFLHVTPCFGFASSQTHFSLTENSSNVGDNRNTISHITFRTNAEAPFLSGSPMSVLADYGDGSGTIISTTTIVLVNDTQYFPRITKSLDGTLKLEMFTDSGRTTQETGSPVSIDASAVANMELKFIQVASFGAGGNGRRQRASIDNVSVTQSAGCPRFQVDAFLQSQANCGTETVLFDTINDATPWTVVGGSQIVVNDIAGVIEWNALQGGGTTTNRRATRAIPSFADNSGRIEMRVKVDKITSTTETGIFMQLQSGTGDPSFVSGSKFLIAIDAPPQGVFATANDGTTNINTSPAIPFADGTTRFLQLVIDPIAQTMTIAVYTDSAFTIHAPSSPQVVDISSLTLTGATTLDTIVTGNFTNSGTTRVITADLDDFTVFTGGCPSFTIDARLIFKPTETFLVDAFIQALGDNGCSGGIFQDDFTTNTNWTQVGTGVSVTGGEIQGWGADGVDRRVFHDLVTPLSDNGWKAEFEIEFSFFSSFFFSPNHNIFGVADVQAPQSTDQDFIGVQFGRSNQINQFGIFVDDHTPSTVALAFNTTIASLGVRYFVRLERLSLTEVKMSIFTGGFDVTPFGSSPTTATIPSTVTGLRFVSSANNDGGSTSRVLTGILDNLVISEGCPSFSVDARVKAFDTNKEFSVDGIAFVPPAKLFLVDGLIKGTIDKTFEVDACLQNSPFFTFEVDACIQQNNNEEVFDVDALIFILPVRAFLVDAIVRYAQGTSLTGGIPDLIIRVLRENPPSLTGREIVSEIVKITSDPAEGFSFRGKTSRIKNWLNRLRLDNLIQEDGSNPDWYRTNWSLV